MIDDPLSLKPVTEWLAENQQYSGWAQAFGSLLALAVAIWLPYLERAVHRGRGDRSAAILMVRAWWAVKECQSAISENDDAHLRALVDELIEIQQQLRALGGDEGFLLNCNWQIARAISNLRAWLDFRDDVLAQERLNYRLEHIAVQGWDARAELPRPYRARFVEDARWGERTAARHDRLHKRDSVKRGRTRTLTSLRLRLIRRVASRLVRLAALRVAPWPKRQTSE